MKREWNKLYERTETSYWPEPGNPKRLKDLKEKKNLFLNKTKDKIR